MKQVALTAMTRAPLLRLGYPFRRGAATILTMHRFADPALGNEGHSAWALRSNLTFLRRQRFEPLALADLVARFEAGTPPPARAVVFTVDDGYADFARMACDVFAQFDWPVTVFLVTGFLDGSCWLWWDQVEYVLAATRRDAAALELGGRPVRYRWSSVRERDGVRADVVERLKRVDDVTRQSALVRLAADIEVEIPGAPPPQYAPMSWEDVRRCEGRGVTFGPHTLTHPILSQVSDARSLEEIGGSWRRVREEVSAATPVFCYPNGAQDSFTVRERSMLTQAGLRAAVTTIQDCASPRAFLADHGEGRYALPRYPYFDEQIHFRQIVSGLERLKRTVLRGWRP